MTVGRVALVNFNNPQGLVKIGSNRYGEGPSAGVRNVGVPGLAELPVEALFAEADRTRAAVHAETDGAARVTAAD